MFDVPHSKRSQVARDARPSVIDRVGIPLLLSPDEVLYRQGEASTSLYYLDSGAVMIGFDSAGGEQCIIAVHGPGVFFGARSLDEEVHNATATALLQSKVVRLSKRTVQGLVQTDPLFTLHFAMQMMCRAARLEEDQIDRAGNSLRKRLARTLLILASLDVESEEAHVLDRMTETMLARMLSANPGCVSKLLYEFREAGHLARGKPLTVYSSLARILLPVHLAKSHGPLFKLMHPRNDGGRTRPRVN